MNTYRFGMIGLGTMGSNLMLNIAENGYSIIGYDKNPEQVSKFLKENKFDNTFATSELNTFISSISKPACIIILVPAGKIVDFVISDIKGLLAPGDIIIDGGNSYFKDTQRRVDELKPLGLHFMGMGVSGGESGARLGPSIMPGGDQEAYQTIAEMLNAIAAKYHDSPCSAYMGNGAAGHYVKMVHNGIEYAIMQLIAESYDILKHNGLSNRRISDIFDRWNQGKLKGYLIESAAKLLQAQDDLGNGDLIDKIKDIAGQKGTGKWTSQEALDLGIPTPSIDNALMVRYFSAMIDVRQTMSKSLNINANIDHDPELIDHLEDALYASMMIAYAQGLQLIVAASSEYHFNTQLKDVVMNWRAGCIIRSVILEDLVKVYDQQPNLVNILLYENIYNLVANNSQNFQRIINYCNNHELGVPVLSAGFGYWCMLNRSTLPTNMIQGLRDYFGAHTFQRTDRDGTFHYPWPLVE